MCRVRAAGQMRFHILHDAVSGLFWLLSSIATDSMVHLDRMVAQAMRQQRDDLDRGIQLN